MRYQEMLAEERDNNMFIRIVNGMISRTGSELSSELSNKTDKSIASIMRTRYTKLDGESSTVMEGSSADERRIDQSNAGDRPPDTIFIMDM